MPDRRGRNNHGRRFPRLNQAKQQWEHWYNGRWHPMPDIPYSAGGNQVTNLYSQWEAGLIQEPQVIQGPEIDWSNIAEYGNAQDAGFEADIDFGEAYNKDEKLFDIAKQLAEGIYDWAH